MQGIPNLVISNLFDFAFPPKNKVVDQEKIKLDGRKAGGCTKIMGDIAIGGRGMRQGREATHNKGPESDDAAAVTASIKRTTNMTGSTCTKKSTSESWGHQ